MGHFCGTIEHGGELLDCKVTWESEGTGITGLCFDVMSVGERDATLDEKQRLDQELCDRMDADMKFCRQISDRIYDSRAEF